MNAKDAWLKQVKHHKKRLKGLPRVGFNPNVGNVEHNISMMNKMLNVGEISNNPISGPFGGDVSAPAGDGAGISMGESLKESFTDPNMIEFLRKHKNDFIENETKNWISIYADAYVTYEESFIPRFTELILSKNKVDPLDKLNYVPEHYAEGLDQINLDPNDHTLTLGEHISGIGTAAFQSCQLLSEVTILEGCTTIGDSAFRGCPNLTEITLPWSIKYIDKNAFADCWQLRDVYYNGTIEDWEKIRITSYFKKGSDFDRIHCLDDDLILYDGGPQN